ncbi:MAG: hypothetical protein MUQ27_02815 [Acidimicrobiia bacterium]|nr:hypothetical protein [Acidimicrobiia bacterium]
MERRFRRIEERGTILDLKDRVRRVSKQRSSLGTRTSMVTVFLLGH